MLERGARAFAQEGAIEEGRNRSIRGRERVCLFLLVVRMYALVCQTSDLRQHLSRDHLSVIGDITEEGKLYMHQKEGAIKGRT